MSACSNGPEGGLTSSPVPVSPCADCGHDTSNHPWPGRKDLTGCAACIASGKRTAIFATLRTSADDSSPAINVEHLANGSKVDPQDGPEQADDGLHTSRITRITIISGCCGGLIWVGLPVAHQRALQLVG